LAAASLERAREQIAVLKAGSEFYEERPARSFTDDLEPAGIELIEVRVGGWELLTERGKLDALLVNIDWRGVSAGDKRGLLEQEVDFGRIAEGDRTAWRGAGSQAGGQPLPSPGEMIRRRREHERQR
jgi:hypothetical protein